MSSREVVDVETGEISDGPVVSIRGRVRMLLGDFAEKLRRKRQLPTGEEIPDAVPMQPPINFVRQPSMIEHVRNMVRSEQLRLAAEAEGAETFDEADDFDIPDDIEPYSAYEMEEVFEPVRPAEPDRAAPKLEDSPGPDGAEPPTGVKPAETAAPAVPQ